MSKPTLAKVASARRMGRVASENIVLSESIVTTSCRRTSLNFKDLLGDLEVEDFLERFWDKREFVGRCDRVSDYLPSTEIETLVHTLGVAHPDWIQLVRDGAAVPASRLSRDDGFLDLISVHQALRAGYTLQLSKMQVRHVPTSHLCADVLREMTVHGVLLSRGIGSHLYLTPPDGKGLRPHFDDHGVFVLQLSGEKEWTLHGPAQPVRERQKGAIERIDLPGPTRTITLHPGSILYVPRGCYHEAEAKQAGSCHLTIDIYTLSYFDVISTALNTCQDTGIAVRVNPRGERSSETVVQEMVELLRGLDLDAALQEVTSKAIKATRPVLPGLGFDHLSHKLN